MSRDAGHGPLIAFTSLAAAGAGLIVASVCLGFAHHQAWPPVLMAGVVLQTLALAVSFGHLGQKRRAALAGRGAGRSALSNEVLLATLALTSGALAAAVELRGVAVPALVAIAGLFNAAFLVSIGLVYRVRGQQTWQGISVLTPLTAGCAFGAIAIQALATTGAVMTTVVLLVLLDAAVFVQRWREVAAIRVPTALRAGSRMASRDRLSWARLILLDVLPVMLLLVGLPLLAAVAAAGGLVMDRVGFYALACQRTTEHEIASVEDLLAAGRHPHEP